MRGQTYTHSHKLLYIKDVRLNLFLRTIMRSLLVIFDCFFNVIVRNCTEKMQGYETSPCKHSVGSLNQSHSASTSRLLGRFFFK